MKTLARIDFPWTLGLAGCAVIATLLLPEALVADFSSIRQGALCKLVTGPWVHATPGHLARDLAVCLLLGAVYEHPLRSRFRWLLLAGLVVPTAAVMLARPGLGFYCGLSGTAHALMVAALTYELRRARGRSAAWITMVAVLFGGKLVFESLAGTMLFPIDLGNTVRPVPLAHMAGALAGLAVTTIGGKRVDPGKPAPRRSAAPP